ncbi:MAG: AIR synthase-related protein, partial [Novosphingobium sp.]
AVAECYRNISAVGATPLAITNCLNFANPQRPEIMAQIVGCLEGMGDACRALDFPIVSGNVSLYNESKATGGGSAILPTPTIGGVGLMQDHEKMATIGFKAEGEAILAIGTHTGHLGQSLWLREIAGCEAGPAPIVDLALERKIGEFVRELIADGLITAVHDVSDGGELVAVTEMALSGDIGATVSWSDEEYPNYDFQLFSGTAAVFGEDQGRYIVTSIEPEAIVGRAKAADIRIRWLGATNDEKHLHVMTEKGGAYLPLTALREASDSFFRDWMEG